jgi:hypothetical protein
MLHLGFYVSPVMKSGTFQLGLQKTQVFCGDFVLHSCNDGAMHSRGCANIWRLLGALLFFFT